MNGHRAGDVPDPAQGDAAGDDLAARLRQRAVAALVHGHVDDHGARPHAPHHLLGDQDGRYFSRHERGENHDVRLFDVRGDRLALLLQPVRGQRLRVAALSGRQVGRDVKAGDLGSQALRRLAGLLADVHRGDRAAQSLGRRNGLQSHHADADHEEPGRLDRPDGRPDHGNELGELVGRHEHRLVAAHRAHGGQGVHPLGPRAPGNVVHREGGDIPVGQHLDGRVIRRGSGMEKRDQEGALPHHLDLVSARFLVEPRLLHFQNEVGADEQAWRVGDDRRAGFPVVAVGSKGPRPGRRLHEDLESHLDVLLHGFRQRCHAPLVFQDFLGDSEDHATPPYGLGNGAAGCPALAALVTTALWGPGPAASSTRRSSRAWSRA